MLKNNTTLEVLDLSSNKIGDTGARYISDAIRHNTALRVLNLKDNGIKDEGVKSISAALKENQGLLEARNYFQ